MNLQSYGRVVYTTELLFGSLASARTLAVAYTHAMTAAVDITCTTMSRLNASS